MTRRRPRVQGVRRRGGPAPGLVALAVGLVVALVVGVVAVAGLGGGGGDDVADGGGSGSTGEAAYPAPAPQRPVVDLAVDVAPDLRSATGRETVTVTPDLAVCELVFRAWPNSPNPFREGNALAVTDAAVDGVPVAPVVRPAGAPEDAPGTLVELPLPECVPAGTTLRADLGYVLSLGEDADELLGVSPSARVAWFGSGYPLLAWVRGQGWHRADAVDIPGETAVSETFRLDSLRVTAPADLTVGAVGRDLGTVPGPRPGTATHTFSAPAVRDVAVAVGAFDVLEREVDGTRLHLLTPSEGTRTDPERWADEIARAVRETAGRFGPFPYDDLWAAVVPGQSSGIEFPGSLQFGDIEADDVADLAVHEVAHQWFYGLVGNDQARDPWIDEAFATYAEVSIGGEEDEYTPASVPDRFRGDLGRPMRYWAERGGFYTYYAGVYRQGAAVMLETRDEVGAERFDEAVRAYVDAHAHQVVDPVELGAFFDDELPELTANLRRAGALGRS